MNAPFQCGCCSNTFPEMYKHTHHKIPTSVGGPNTRENLIDLCPGCHDALHNVAYKLLSRKHQDSMVLDTIHMIFKSNTKAQKVCKELALNVRDAMIKSKEEGLGLDHVMSISTSLRKKYKDFVALRCRELGVSQEKYFRQLILQDLLSRYKCSGLNIAHEHEYIAHSKKKHS